MNEKTEKSATSIPHRTERWWAKWYLRIPPFPPHCNAY
jgi:hypothetical protein